MTQQKLELGLYEIPAMSRYQYIDEFRATARKLLQTKPYITSNEVRALLPLPDNLHPNCIGAAMQYKDFVPTGWVHSTRRAAHGRSIQLFRLRRMDEDV